MSLKVPPLYFIAIIPAAFTVFITCAILSYYTYRALKLRLLPVEKIPLIEDLLMMFISWSILGLNTVLGWSFFLAVGNSLAVLDLMIVSFRPFPLALMFFFQLHALYCFFALKVADEIRGYETKFTTLLGISLYLVIVGITFIPQNYFGAEPPPQEIFLEPITALLVLIFQTIILIVALRNISSKLKEGKDPIMRRRYKIIAWGFIFAVIYLVILGIGYAFREIATLRPYAIPSLLISGLFAIASVLSIYIGFLTPAFLLRRWTKRT